MGVKNINIVGVLLAIVPLPPLLIECNAYFICYVYTLGVCAYLVCVKMFVPSQSTAC